MSAHIHKHRSWGAFGSSIYVCHTKWLPIWKFHQSMELNDNAEKNGEKQWSEWRVSDFHIMSNPADYSLSKFENQKNGHNSFKKPPIGLKVTEMESLELWAYASVLRLQSTATIKSKRIKCSFGTSNRIPIPRESTFYFPMRTILNRGHPLEVHKYNPAWWWGVSYYV